MRTPLIAGNWKMHKTIGQAMELVEGLKPHLAQVKGVEVAICPPFVALAAVRAALEGTEIALGAQDIFWEEEGAFTGMVSPVMLADLGCKYVIIGHSERRGRFGKADESLTPELMQIFGDTDASVNRKAQAALAHNLTPIICVGEMLAEREQGKADAVVGSQVQKALQGLPADRVAGLVMAYEPVWAIGTGKNCEDEEANRVVRIIRGAIRSDFNQATAESVRIQYGGSVKPDNIGQLMDQPEVDGALVGGASLKVDQFAEIVKIAAERSR